MRIYLFTIALINELVRPAPCLEQEARVRKRNCHAELIKKNSCIPENYA
ncbi:MAG: hypothetical protein K8S62_05795 [Candidatus Sabulitectum sp.]|nr:hypothetical protein [Candidatus Sabulitectum sp.]